jgi:hypothetical protein
MRTVSKLCLNACTLISGTLAGLASCLAVPNARANDSNQQAFEATLDIAFRSVRDDLLVPFAFTGPQFSLIPRYLGFVGPGLVDAQLRLGFAPVFDRFGHNGKAATYGLRAGYFFILSEGKVGWALGPVLGWDYEMFEPDSWDDAHGYWLGTRWLGPGVRTWRRLEAGYRLAFSADVSVIGFESRPPTYRYNKQDATTHFVWYFSEPTKNAEFGWVPNFQVLRLAGEIHRGGERVPSSWGLGSELSFTHAAEPASAFAFQMSLQVSHAWSF